MTTTAQDLIRGAYKDLGLRIISADQETEGLSILNDMFSRWSAQKLLVHPPSIEENFALVAGQSRYTIGVSGNFNTVRPTRIVKAFIRDANATDYPVDVEMALGDYVEITAKSQRLRPERLWYSPEFPLGIIQFESAPAVVETLWLYSQKPLPVFATLATTVDLPSEYLEPMRMNLAAMISPRVGVPLDPLYTQIAAGSLSVLSSRNAPPTPVARFDSALSRTLAP